MANPLARFHDVITGEVIDRPLTDVEYEELINPKSTILPWTVNE